MYLAVRLLEVVFATGGNEVRSTCIFSACQMAFGKKLALTRAFASYMLAELKLVTFLIKDKNHTIDFSQSIFCTPGLSHCDGLHALNNGPGKPFVWSVANGESKTRQKLVAEI